jgi:hypothetical protein
MINRRAGRPQTPRPAHTGFVKRPVEVMEPTLTRYGCDGSGSIPADRALTERQFRQEKQHANRRQYLHNENIRRHGLNWFRLPQSAEALRRPKASATPSFSAAY